MDEDELYAMYGNREDEPKINRTVMKPLENKSAKTRKINVGIAGYEVPTVEHVASLEKKIESLEQQTVLQNAKIRRMESLITKLRAEIGKTHASIGAMNKEIDQKIDRRD